jgi:hypothetical protein
MTGSDREGAVDDKLRSQPRPQPVQVSRVVALINNLVEAVYSVGDDAEDAYRAALEDLRAVADEAAIALARLESDSDRRNYPRRWALIYAAAQLEHEAVLPFLCQVVLTPIPPEQSANPHSFSTVKEETVLRSTAVEGVGTLAARGNDRARDSLLEFLSMDSISIRRASVQSLLAIDGGMREQIAERLPRDFYYLLEIRPVGVADVTQIKDPRQHLREKRLPEKPTPPEPESGKGPSEQRRPEMGDQP